MEKIVKTDAEWRARLAALLGTTYDAEERRMLEAALRELL